MADVNITTQLEGLSQVEAELRKLVAQLGGAQNQLGGVGKGATDAQKGVSALSGGMRMLNQELSRFVPPSLAPYISMLATATTGTVAFAGTVALTAGAIVGLTMSLGNTVEQLDNTATRLSMTTEQVERLQFVADQSGTSFDALSYTVFELQRRMSMAAEGNKQMRKAFDDLGMGIFDAKGEMISGYDALMQLDKLLANMEGPEKGRVAMEVGGRGMRMALAAMKGDMQEVADKAPVMSEALKKAGRESDDAFDGMSAQFKSLKIQIMTDMIPTFQGVSKEVKGMSDAMAKGEGFSYFLGWMKDVLYYMNPALIGLHALGVELGWISDKAKEVPQSSAMFKDISKGAADLRGELKMTQDQLDVLFKSQGVPTEKLPAAPTTPNDWSKATGGGAGANAAGKAAKDALAPLKSMNEELQRSVATFGMSDTAAKEWNLTQGELSKITGRGAEALRQQNLALLSTLAAKQAAKRLVDQEAEAMKAINDEFDKGTDAFKSYNEAQAEEVKQLEDLADPMRVYARELANIELLQRQFGLSAEAAAKATEDAAKRYGDAMDRTGDKTDDIFQDIKGELEGFGRELTDAMDEGDRSISAFFEDILDTFAKILTKKFIADPIVKWLENEVIPAIQNAFNSLKSVGSGGGGGLGGLLDDILGGAILGGGSVGSNIPTNLFSGASLNFSAAGLSSGFSGWFQGGGVIPAGYSGWVGENGPELLTPETSSRITPVGEEVNINFTVYAMDSRDVLRMLYEQSDAITSIVHRAFNKRGKAGIYD